MRDLSFPVRGLGSAKPKPPAAGDLGTWIQNHKGHAADLTTWELEETLKLQSPVVAFPAAGGMFYRDRILAAFPNVSGERILGEFDLQPEEISTDCAAAGTITKGCWWAVPSPQALHLADAYFMDADESDEACADAVTLVCRVMRDGGSAGHILLYDDAPDAVDLEHFSGRRFLRYVPDAFLADVLEVQRDLILSAESVPHLAELADCYAIRQVYVADPTAEALAEACRQFDADDVFCAGTAPESNQEAYWKSMAELRIQVADI